MKTISKILAVMLFLAASMQVQAAGSKAQKAKMNASVMTALGFKGQTFKQKKDNVWTVGKNVSVYSSAAYGSRIAGFGGPVPVFVAVGKDGKIISVAPGPNAESPEFFDVVKQSGLFKKWKGVTLKKAQTYKPDGVTGATYSSSAVIKNVQATAKAVAK